MASFLSNPLTQERLQKIQDNAVEFLKTFAKEYPLMCAAALLESIKEESVTKEDSRKLKYREWDDIERSELFTGYVYMKTGLPGNWSGTKQVFLVERQDYNIDLYASEKDYEKDDEKKQKSKGCIRVCGYEVVRHPTSRYYEKMAEISAGLGLTEDERRQLATCSQYSWSLRHSIRPNYLFQLHKSKQPLCPCFGGNAVDPEDLGADEAKKDRERYLFFMERCVARCSARDTNTVPGAGFEKVIGKFQSILANLTDWEDDGTEPEILVDALLEQCLTPLRNEILADIKGPLTVRLTAWYKVQESVRSSMQSLVDPAWGAAQGAAKELCSVVEPKIRSTLDPIYKKREEVKNKIRAAIISKMGEFLAKIVTPYLKPVFQAFDKPMLKGFQGAKGTFESAVDFTKLSGSEKEINRKLDAIPRTSDNVRSALDAADELVAPLDALKTLSEELFGELNPAEHRDSAEIAILTTLDAAIYTVELKITKDGNTGGNDKKGPILKDFDFDVEVARAEFMKAVTREILLGNFKKALGPVATPLLAGFDGLIPDEMKDFLNIYAIYEEIVDLFVGEPIDKMVEAAYPPPKK